MAPLSDFHADRMATILSPGFGRWDTPRKRPVPPVDGKGRASRKWVSFPDEFFAATPPTDRAGCEIGQGCSLARFHQPLWLRNRGRGEYWDVCRDSKGRQGWQSL